MIHFRTPGTLQLEGLTTFGLTSKEETSIGRFGTGLKYATAIVMRLGGSIRIRTPQATLRIGVEPAMFRNKAVLHCTLDGARLPFTTELGRDWKPWMAFREFYANTLDEGGTFGPGFCEPCGDETVIEIDCAEFEAVLDNFEEHFIDPAEEPLFESPNIRIFHGRSKQIFYRGFAVAELTEPAQYRYDLKGALGLTEDRTASSLWDVFGRIEREIAYCTSEPILRNTLRADAPFEGALSYSAWNPSAAFCGIVEELGDAVAAPQAILAAAKKRYAEQRDDPAMLEEAGKSSASLMQAVAHLKLISADLSGLRFALLPIPSGADYETDNFRKLIIINEKHRGDDAECIKLMICAYCLLRPTFAAERLVKLAHEIANSARKGGAA